MALSIPIFQIRKVRCGSHGWKWSEPRSDASVLCGSRAPIFFPFCLLVVERLFSRPLPRNRCVGFVCFPGCQLLLIWGGKMNLALVNAMLLIDLGKCLAAPIHLPKGNVIRAWIILLLSLGSEYATFVSLTISSMSHENKQTHGIDTSSRHVFLHTMKLGVGVWRELEVQGFEQLYDRAQSFRRSAP